MNKVCVVETVDTFPCQALGDSGSQALFVDAASMDEAMSELRRRYPLALGYKVSGTVLY